MYTTLIQKIDPDINAVGVECSMRLQYGTLGHLDRSTFATEVALARACEAQEPGFLRRVAESYGRGAEYGADERRLTERRNPDNDDGRKTR